MRLKLLVLVLCAIALRANLSFAQGSTKQISKQLSLVSDTLVLDTNYIIKGSVQIKGFVQGVDYSINYYQGLLLNLAIPKFQNLVVTYKIYPKTLQSRYQLKDTTLVLPSVIAGKNPFEYVPQANSFEPIGVKDGLLVNGSIMRGLSVGNTQNAVVNANLNLQLNGRLNNEIDVLAAISDDNNPIQPEGNTQELQDFDQVFVQFSKNKNKVVVGDYLMLNPSPSYFMNYQKKSRGLQLMAASNHNNKNNWYASAEAALSRGRFVRNVINGVEGNQGPYRLTGPNGELFIILVSGTEAVYLDGERLSRGEQNDYIIDYNTGEITFMAKRLITQYSRIVVEFQYADRYYARTVLASQTGYKTKNTHTYLNYFNEGDNKNQPFQQLLSDTNKLLLASVGDNLNQAFISSATPVFPFDASKILYRQTDTLGFNNVFIHVPTATQDSPFYELRFTYLGPGKGNYKQSSSATNGRVFEWVQPVNGQPAGDFEPVTYLVAPNRRQMLSAGSRMNYAKNQTLLAEINVSGNNKNLYSELDRQDNVGVGIRLESSNRIAFKDTTQYLESLVFYETVDANFRYIERYRAVEFDRIWNRQLQNNAEKDTGYREHILNWRLGLNLHPGFKVNYQLGYYNRAQSAFLGLRHVGGLLFQNNNNKLVAGAEWVNSLNKSLAANQTNSQVNQYAIDYTRRLGKVLGSVRTKTETSKFLNANDSLLSGSFSYLAAGLNIKNADSLTLAWFADYQYRLDKLPFNSELKDHTLANEYKGGIRLLQKNLNRLQADLALRDFRVLDTAFSNLKPELTLLSRIEYDYSFLKRKITANSYVQLGSGNELRRDFQYLEVPVGQGVYIWKDFNEDGVKQLNEFQPASFADKNLANYIRVFLPTTSLISTYSTQFSQTININPASPVKGIKSLKNFMRKFSNQAGIRYEKKTGADERLNVSRFLTFNPADTALIALTSILRNTLFFNRSNAVWGMDLGWYRQQNKNLQTNGFERRGREDLTFNFRFNFNQNWTYTQSFVQGEKLLNSEFFLENNYRYQYLEVKPKISYQQGQSWRISVQYMLQQANNQPEFGTEQSKVNQLGTELRYTLPKLGVVTVQYSFYEVNFNGNLNSALAYDMLQGLSAGNNQLWNLTLQQRIGQNLQINLTYDGRKSENLPIIHTGKMEARYLF